jgi:hypothetical protein
VVWYLYRALELFPLNIHGARKAIQCNSDRQHLARLRHRQIICLSSAYGYALCGGHHD